MAFTAQFLDRQGKLQSRLLALRRQLGCHSGENLALTLGQVVREWKIKDRVGTVISDNASSNDNCLMSFYDDLDVGMGLADIRARRMRCYGHILNLVARAFLYGEDFEDRKLFYHAVPDEAAGENTNSQVEPARGRPDRNRQLPARFRDCEMDVHPRKPMQSFLSGGCLGQCDDGSGKPSK